jgi:hypothetical protein
MRSDRQLLALKNICQFRKELLVALVYPSERRVHFLGVTRFVTGRRKFVLLGVDNFLGSHSVFMFFVASAKRINVGRRLTVLSKNRL